MSHRRRRKSSPRIERARLARKQARIVWTICGILAVAAAIALWYDHFYIDHTREKNEPPEPLEVTRLEMPTPEPEPAPPEPAPEQVTKRRVPLPKIRAESEPVYIPRHTSTEVGNTRAQESKVVTHTPLPPAAPPIIRSMPTSRVMKAPPPSKKKKEKKKKKRKPTVVVIDEDPPAIDHNPVYGPGGVEVREVNAHPVAE